MSRSKFRGRVVFSGGIVNQDSTFREKIDPTFPGNVPSAPVGEGSGGGSLAWDPDGTGVARANTIVWLSNNQTVSWRFRRGGNVYLGNAISGEGTITYSASGLPSGLSIDSATGELIGSSSNVGYNLVTVTASDGTTEISKPIYVLQRSQQEFTTSGTFTLTLPNYIDKIHAVCVGGGGASGTGPATPTSFGRGTGGGGGLRWIQDLPVSGGEQLTITVGAGGQAYKYPAPAPAPLTPAWAGAPGTPSKIVRNVGTPTETILLEATGGGGSEGLVNPAPSFLVSGGGGTSFGLKPSGAFVGGGNGGEGIYNLSPSPNIAGGAGAGGYDGTGGRGHRMPSPTSSSLVGSTNPSTTNFGLRRENGRGGAGDGGGKNPSVGGGGGGVGIWGARLGSNSPENVQLAPPAPSIHPAAATIPATDPYLDYLEKPQDRSPIGWNTPTGIVSHPIQPSITAPLVGGTIYGWGGSFGLNTKTRPSAYAPAAPLFDYNPPPSTTLAANGSEGGIFGGGGGVNSGSISHGPFFQGGKGAVRVMWGGDREWPSKNTGDH
jgi:hypothetical protein